MKKKPQKFPVRYWAGMVFLLGLLPVTGCALRESVSFSDRCAEVMHEAFPGGGIKVGKEEASVKGIRVVTAEVFGERTDLPAHSPLARDLAVECRFESGILTEFHWTKGPLH